MEAPVPQPLRNGNAVKHQLSVTSGNPRIGRTQSCACDRSSGGTCCMSLEMLSSIATQRAAPAWPVCTPVLQFQPANKAQLEPKWGW